MWRGKQYLELNKERRKEGKEERDGEEVAVEEVLMPVGTVFGVGELRVETHYCGEELRDEEDQETGHEFWVDREGG